MPNALYSIYAWTVWSLCLVVLGLPAVLLTAIAPELGFRFVRAGSRFALWASGIPVRVRGLEHCGDQAYVVMGNHQSLLDPFVVLRAFRRRPIAIEKVENLKVPVYGWLTRAWGNIPIKREDREAAIAGVDSARERLAQGHCIGIMPEGTRTKDGTLGPFKKGGFHLAIAAGAAILPFTINGAFGRLARGGWRVRPGPIEVVFGEPIPTTGYTKETMDALMARVRAAIEANMRP
jgi:1-acyl-sn-glycerol-3-phosphate acyltransferase